jgi:hypothetical protein
VDGTAWLEWFGEMGRGERKGESRDESGRVVSCMHIRSQINGYIYIYIYINIYCRRNYG